jgi:MFS family permease
VVVLVAFALLVANGRPLSAPATAGPAAWLLSAGLALASLAFELDATGTALVGKALAAFFAALAAGALFGAVARRHGPSEGRWAGLVLAIGTTLAAAAQAWSGEQAATCAVAVAVLLLVRAEEEARAAPAALAGLPLGLAVALQPSAAALALALVLAVLVRWRARGLLVLAWAAPGALLAFGSLLGSPGGSLAATPTAAGSAAPGASALALLASPARGLVLFAPVALVGLAGVVRALRQPRHRLWDQAQPSRLLPVACLAAAVAHVSWLAVVGGWHEGPFWGPRLVAPAWPLLLLYLPEGFAALKLVATVLVVASIGVQGLGALSYDGRWDKLYGSGAGSRTAETWDFTKSPILFQARERAARVAIPGVEGRRLTSRQRVFSPRAAAGSFASFARLPPVPTGADATFDGLRFEGDARFEAGVLALAKEGDGLAIHVREGAWPRRLELRVVGRGQGRIGVAESGSGSGTRWRDESVAGAFRLRLPYFHADSGGADLKIVLRSGGPISLESVALVPPSEPDNVLRLP